MEDYERKLKKFLIPILRRKSLYWTGRQEAIRAARKERGLYECNNCKKTFGIKEIHVDHISPVVNVKTSFTTWDSYITSLYCDSSNLQSLCVQCHSVKSSLESNMRKINNKKNKKTIDKSKKK